MLSEVVMSYEEAKDVFYKSNFFDWEKDDNTSFNLKKEDFFDEMRFVYDEDIVKLRPFTFLHGKCDEFAVALAKKMGYKVGIVYEFDDYPGTFAQLIHAYCVKEDDSKEYNIDIRGICPNHCEIASDNEFDYCSDSIDYEIMDVEDAISFFIENMSDCRKYDHYDTLNEEALKIIDLFKDKFII